MQLPQPIAYFASYLFFGQVACSSEHISREIPVSVPLFFSLPFSSNHVHPSVRHRSGATTCSVRFVLDQSHHIQQSSRYTDFFFSFFDLDVNSPNPNVSDLTSGTSSSTRVVYCLLPCEGEKDDLKVVITLDHAGGKEQTIVELGSADLTGSRRLALVTAVARRKSPDTFGRGPLAVVQSYLRRGARRCLVYR